MSDMLQEFNRAVETLKALKSGDLVLFVLRHAESTGQKRQSEYKTLGDSNIPLTEHGIEQARSTGRVLSALFTAAQLEKIHQFSSTGHRSTRTTIEIFNQLNEHDPYINFDARLDKQKFGSFDGLFTKEERKARNPQGFEAFENQCEKEGLFYARPPNGESIEDVRIRMIPFFEEHTKENKPLVVITHGTNALCLEDIALNRGVEWIMARLDTRPNCAIRMITGNKGDGFKAITLCVNPIEMEQTLKQAGIIEPAP